MGSLRIYSILIFSLFFGLARAPLCAESFVLTTGYSPPYSTAASSGILDRILEEAFARAGHEVSFAMLPAERALRDADSGVADGVVARIDGLDDSYRNLVRIPVSIIESWDFVAFTRPHVSDIRQWSDLSNHNVVFVRGWKIIEQNIPAARSVVTVSSTELAFRMLARGRADVVVSARLDGVVMARQLGFEDLKVHEPPLASLSLYPYIHRRHEELVPALAQALGDMKADGTFYEIYASVLSRE
ncbi:MAG: substrate-binding periplasmic protein [Spirochaetales bacterium]